MVKTIGEYNPDTLEIESRLREGLRDILRVTPDVRDDALLAEVRRLKRADDNTEDVKLRFPSV